MHSPSRYSQGGNTALQVSCLMERWNLKKKKEWLMSFMPFTKRCEIQHFTLFQSVSNYCGLIWSLPRVLKVFSPMTGFSKAIDSWEIWHYQCINSLMDSYSDAITGRWWTSGGGGSRPLEGSLGRHALPLESSDHFKVLRRSLFHIPDAMKPRPMKEVHQKL